MLSLFCESLSLSLSLTHTIAHTYTHARTLHASPFHIFLLHTKTVVTFIDSDNSGSISISEFQDVFSLIKRNEAMKSMGGDALAIMKKILKWKESNRKSIDQIFEILDKVRRRRR